MTQKAEIEAFFKKVQHSRVFNNILELFNLKQKSVLDVGCSEGHHLACFGEGSVGITIIDEHVEMGREMGLNILSKNVESTDFRMDTTFDVIWANNIFEHLNAPHTFLLKMKSCLNEDGVLILGVPIIPNVTWLGNFKKFRGAYAASHVNFFYRKTLIETVRAAGWEVEEARLFYMKNSFLDWFFNIIAPHMYIVAKPKEDFAFGEKRMKSLKGYDGYENLS